MMTRRQAIGAMAGTLATSVTHGQDGFLDTITAPRTFVGRTAHVRVFAANALGIRGRTVAQRFLARAEIHYHQVEFLFRRCVFVPVPTELTIGHTPSGFGFRQGFTTFCYADVREDPATGQYDPQFTAAVWIKLMAEQFCRVSGSLWDVRSSPGEALTRTIANLLLPGKLAGAQVVPTWLNSRYRPNYLDRNARTTFNDQANGCVAAYLYWAVRMLGLDLSILIATPFDTVAEKHAHVTGQGGAYIGLYRATNAKYPRGTPVPDDIAHEDWVLADTSRAPANPLRPQPVPPVTTF